MNLKIFLSIFIIFIFIGLIGGLYVKTQSDIKIPLSKVHNVSLLSNKAVPDFITIKPGEYVQFNSKDGKTHVIAQGHGSAFGDQHEHIVGGLESPQIKANEGYKILFKKVGTYDFHDHENPNIFITVLVYK